MRRTEVTNQLYKYAINNKTFQMFLYYPIVCITSLLKLMRRPEVTDQLYKYAINKETFQTFLCHPIAFLCHQITFLCHQIVYLFKIQIFASVC